MPNPSDTKAPPQAVFSPDDNPSDRKEKSLKLKFSLSGLIRKRDTNETVPEPEPEDNSSDAGNEDSDDDDDDDDEDMNHRDGDEIDDTSMDYDEEEVGDGMRNEEEGQENNSSMEYDTNSQSQDGDEEKVQEPEVNTRRTRSSSVDVSNNDHHEENVAVAKKKEEVESTQATRSTSFISDADYVGFRSPVTTTPTASFLDSLPHDQHRMRPRHLPDVSGFRRLHKAEIKRDLTLVRKLLKSNRHERKEMEDDDGNEMETESGAVSDGSPSEDEGNTSHKPNLGRGQFDEEQLLSILENPDLPNIFSLPYTESPYICPDVEGKSTKNLLYSAPNIVDSISAFNPPRPPESVGPKKMHRLQRWENDPQAVDIDLTKYRKTVERTRFELLKMEDERERIETCGEHFRIHFMNHLQCMRQEMSLLNHSYDVMQSKCLKAADLFQFKTRSRGISKSTNMMKEVLLELKNRGAKIDYTNTKVQQSPVRCYPGVGGVSWTPNSPLASGWLLPGDIVSSPYGEGSVDRLLEPCVSENPLESTNLKNSIGIIPPRVCVKLPFGIGYFPPNSLKIIENTPLLCDDNVLAKKWLSMVNSCFAAGSITDFNAVDNYGATHPKSLKESGIAMDDAADIDLISSTPKSADVHMEKLLPYGSSLLPSSTVRGAAIESLSIDLMEKSINSMITNSRGILGRYNNPDIPAEYSKWELDREKLRMVEGQVKRLRNALIRQKRLRFLNERSRDSARDKRHRFEALLSEMKSDLDSLKHRLNEELHEIGIDQNHAQELLSDFYESRYGSKRKSSVTNMGLGKRSRLN